ncbi:MAG: RHS repeat protein [Deltaproteobacteria bacterium]|nr:RHS repeat protein [Deltaproteobacteria bacterium]
MNKLFSLFLLSLFLALGRGQLQAQVPKVIYIYDDLGRLTRVVNENNECATYEYDAVGNLLSITRDTNCLQPPTIDGLSQDTAQVGDTTCITISGSNFIGATVTTDNPDVQFSRVRVSETSIEVCLTISPFSSVGITRIIISTPGGVAERAIAINPKIVVFTQNTTIGRTDLRFEGADLTIEGAVTVMIDGSHRFASLTLRNGAFVTHSAATATSISKLDLTVHGTLAIDAPSRIDVTGRGFLGGMQPGNPFAGSGMTIGFQRGSTGTSGGSYGGLGGPSVVGSSNPVYGDFRDPNDPGSGGATDINAAAGNGGGLIRIVAQTLQLNGSIIANGDGSDRVGGGSGGGIRIDVATLQGTGVIRSNGGNGLSAGGGGGRIAVYYQNVVGFDLTRVTAFGGVSNAGAGTIYLQPGGETGELVVDNNSVIAPSLSTPIVPVPAGPLNLSNLTVRRGARARLDNQTNLRGTVEVSSGGELTLRGERLVASLINVNNGGVITHLLTTASAFFKVDLSADTLVVDATGRIGAGARGFLGGLQPGNPFLGGDGMTVSFQKGSRGTSGGSYGGLGGGSSPNLLYGNPQDPNEPGSGGATDTNAFGGSGGGLIRIVAQTIQHDGFIGANGGVSDRVGGGSGGGIRIDVGTLRGTGVIVANGGNGGLNGGGGGRITMYYKDITGFDQSRITASAGTPNGQNGTVFLQLTDP